MKHATIIFRNLLLAAIGAALPLTVTDLQGIGFRIPNQDAFATGRANAFVATADNPSAVYYNPAGITQLEGTQTSSGIYLINIRSQFTGNDGHRARNQNRTEPVPHVYLTHQVEGTPVTVGVGVAAPFGLSNTWNPWPANSRFGASTQSGEITYLSVMPVAAVQISPTLSIGGGPTLNSAEFDIRIPIIQPPFPRGSYQVEGKDNSVGYHFGIFWHPNPQHAFGAAYRSRETLNLRGHAHTIIPGIMDIRPRAEADLPLPEFFVIGYSFRPTPNWNFEANVDWTRWSRLGTVLVNEDSGEVNEFAFNWKTSVMVNLGVTRYLQDGYRIGGGYTFSENSVPTEFFDPVAPDGDRHLITLALGRTKHRVTWDVSLQYGYSPTRTIPDTIGPPPQFGGNFRTNVTAAIGTFAFAF